MTRESGRPFREQNRYPTTPQQRPPRRQGIVRSPTNRNQGYRPMRRVKVVKDVGFCGNREKRLSWEC
ncbi:hypothetical protein KCP69_00490 [Salmonella enterica subsp. enterica]|nr:hypothetical protein KCP69_00490 [Salmonella enterica subsp. enterica]